MACEPGSASSFPQGQQKQFQETAEGLGELKSLEQKASGSLSGRRGMVTSCPLLSTGSSLGPLWGPQAHSLLLSISLGLVFAAPT